MNFRNQLLLSCFLLAGIITLLARQVRETRADAVLAIEQKRYDDANRILNSLFHEYAQKSQPDSFCKLLPLHAAIAFAKNGLDAASDTIEQFIKRVLAVDNTTALHRQLYMDAAEFYANVGSSQRGYEAEEKALAITRTEPNPSPAVIAKLEYNMGVYAQRLGNVQLSETHHRKAMLLRENDPSVSFEDRYLSYNAMGAVMWFASKQDSSAHFFNLSLSMLEKMPPEPANKYYRRSIVLNNLAGLYSELGRYSDAIKAQEECIHISQLFLDDPAPHPKKASAESGLYQGVDNLAGLFKEVGDFKRAGELLQYSYAKKKERLGAGHADIFISEVLLGQHFTDIREYDKAIEYLEKGLKKIDETDGDYLYWEGDACYSMARSLDALGRVGEAKQYYNRAEKLFHNSYQKSYDNSYLAFLRNTALFWARNNEWERARSIAQNGYDYIQKVQGPGTLSGFYQLLNLAEVHQLAGQHRESMRFANEALKILNVQVGKADNKLDSVKRQLYHPQAILIHEKSRYALTANKDSNFLASVSVELEKAIRILEQRKFLVDDPESINILMAENAALLEFAKQVEMERYRLNGDETLLDRFINLHESTLYTRIRSRLDKAHAIRFANLPESLQDEEQKLKAAMSASLMGENGAGFTEYQHARSAWDNYLQKLRNEYPGYYEMRYASLTRDWQSMQSELAPGQTIVRYYFVADSLYALIIDRENRLLLPLSAFDLANRVEQLYAANSSSKVPAELLSGLYNDLWAPLEKYIHHSNVIIIPDGVLFALSFDMLPFAPVSQYSDLAEKGLIAKHAITYQYSLFLVGKGHTSSAHEKNYVAFVPGFDEKAKSNYRRKVADSVLLDQTYLRLLSQPNTRGLALKLSKKLGGKAFTDGLSTIEKFRNQANGHKIVHIGTHAEYDNMRPDRSRLIFSKDASGSDSNALYLEDIYACRVESELTLLTACESGKPGFQDGEGMVSLAHAFNYAGSQNILMGLWKIDEKSSSQITDRMIEYLRKGESAAVALQKAKLDYLKTAQGRTAAPAYWAGLVMMGDATAIQFAPPGFNWSLVWWGSGIIALAFLVVFAVKRRETIMRPVSA